MLPLGRSEVGGLCRTRLGRSVCCFLPGGSVVLGVDTYGKLWGFVMVLIYGGVCYWGYRC